MKKAYSIQQAEWEMSVFTYFHSIQFANARVRMIQRFKNDFMLLAKLGLANKKLPI